MFFFFFKQKTAYECRIRDWSSDVCSSDLVDRHDTALACNLALRRDRPVPEDRLLAMHRITVFETQLRNGDSETARENGSQRWHDLLIDLMDEGQLVPVEGIRRQAKTERSEEHTSELQSLMRISYAVFCLKKKQQNRK